MTNCKSLAAHTMWKTGWFRSTLIRIKQPLYAVRGPETRLFERDIFGLPSFSKFNEITQLYPEPAT